MTLVLRPNQFDSPEKRDYSATCGKGEIGRIYFGFGHQQRWFWFLNGVPMHPPTTGSEDTLEAAAAALQCRWDQWLDEFGLCERSA